MTPPATEQGQLELEGLSVRYVVRRQSQRRRRLALRVSPSGDVEVRVPQHTSQDEIDAMLRRQCRRRRLLNIAVATIFPIWVSVGNCALSRGVARAFFPNSVCWLSKPEIEARKIFAACFYAGYAIAAATILPLA